TLKYGKKAAPCGMDSLIRTSRWKPRLATVDLVYMRIWKNYNMFKGATAAGRLCAGMKKHVMWCKDWETVNDSISTGSVHPDSNIVARLSNCQNPLKPKEPFISTKVIVKVTHVFTYEIARRHDLWAVRRIYQSSFYVAVFGLQSDIPKTDWPRMNNNSKEEDNLKRVMISDNSNGSTKAISVDEVWYGECILLARAGLRLTLPCGYAIWVSTFWYSQYCMR
ncbi:11110_t:CDS:2, partial [Entrophospora sp. SA101]